MRDLQNHNWKRICTLLYITVVLLIIFSQSADAQFRANWLSAGSLHNWYSEIGCEIEVGLRAGAANQQLGMRWPGIYALQDMQAAKALWIGVKNFTDPRGDFWDRIHLYKYR